MNSQRRTLLTIAAVIVALAVGLVVGAVYIDQRGSGSASQDDLDRATAELTQTRQDLATATTRAGELGAQVAPHVLRDNSVLVLTTPGVTDAQLRTALGAVPANRLTLTAQLLQDTQAAALSSMIDQLNPGKLRTDLVDSGGRLGDLLGALLLRKTVDDAKKVTVPTDALQTLQQGGFVHYDKPPVGANAVVVITSDAQGGNVVASLAAALRQRAQGGLLAGPATALDVGGALSIVRDSPQLQSAVSTVDDLDTPYGPVTLRATLAASLGGTTGHYGVGHGATAFIPAAS